MKKLSLTAFNSFFPGAYILRSLPDFFKHSSVLGIGGEKFKTLTVSAMELRTKDQDSLKNNPKDKQKDCPLEDWNVEGVSGVKFHFKDTCSFQQERLASLVDRLNKAGKPLSLLKQSDLVIDYKGCFSEKLFQLAHVKIQYPYEMVSSVQVLSMKDPPSMQDFNSSLGLGSSINPENYQLFLHTWNVLKEEKFGSEMCLGLYTGFYNQLDTILLAEVHTSFRQLVKEQYEVFSQIFIHSLLKIQISAQVSVDWFITLPSLAFDALLRMLQKEGQEIELISDEEIYRFVQKALRVSIFHNHIYIFLSFFH